MDSLMWYKWVKKFVYGNGGNSSITDPALFMWHCNNKLSCIMTVHEDNFLCARTDSYFIKMTSINCKKYFQLGEKKL